MKDRELITIKEKCAHVEMEKERLEDKLKRIKMAESWEKMSPRSSIAGEPFSPLVSEATNVVCNDLPHVLLLLYSRYIDSCYIHNLSHNNCWQCDLINVQI